MRIAYRQGLISAQDSFLINDVGADRYIDIIVNPTPVIAAVAAGDVDYLITEQRTVPNAWGPFTGTATKYLFWEINQANGSVTRSSTTLAPLSGSNEPPTPQVHQMWWDSSVNLMKVFNGTRWVNTLRVLAGELRSGSTMIRANFESQVGLNTPADAGAIMSDGLGGSFKNSKGEFLTTDTDLSSIDTGSQVKLDGAQIVLQANENIPKFSSVYILNGRVALASGQAPDEITKAPIAIITVDAFQNDAVTLVTAGKTVINEQWNFSGANIGKKVYAAADGSLTLTQPLVHKRTVVGMVVGNKSVLLTFSNDADVLAISGAISSISVNAPLGISGSPSDPVIGISRADSLTDGYISAADMARIDSLEVDVANKADISHGHPISAITGLASAILSKANVGHGHLITDTSGLADALDGKADIAHTHPNPVVDISDVTGLIDALGNKSDVGHSHVVAISDITGLDLALNDKASTVHSHAMADVTGLEGALSNKSDVGHSHLISELLDATIASPTAGQVLTYNGIKWVNAASSGGSGGSGPELVAYLQLISADPISFPATHVHTATIFKTDLDAAIAAYDGVAPGFSFNVITSVFEHSHTLTVFYDYADGTIAVTAISDNTLDNHAAVQVSYSDKLNDLADVNVNVDGNNDPTGGPQNGEVLTFSTSNNKWISRPVVTNPPPAVEPIIYSDWYQSGNFILPALGSISDGLTYPAAGNNQNSTWYGDPLNNPAGHVAKIQPADIDYAFFPDSIGLYMVQLDLVVTNYNNFAANELSTIKFKLVADNGDTFKDGPEQTVIVFAKDTGSFSKSISFTHHMVPDIAYKLAIWQDSTTAPITVTFDSRLRFIRLLEMDALLED